jgi:hypothetical protein
MNNTQKGSSRYWIIILGIVLIIVIGFLLFKNNSSQNQMIQVGMEKTPDVKPVKEQLDLKYIKYDGVADKSVIAKFNDSSLKELISGSQSLGESFVDVGDGNINVAIDEFALDKGTKVYIKLITDNEISAFIFKTDSLRKFFTNLYPEQNATAVQNPNDFIPLEKIQGSYTEITLDAGEYSLVYIPNEKAVKIDTTVKIK